MVLMMPSPKFSYGADEAPSKKEIPLIFFCKNNILSYIQGKIVVLHTESF
jgi:hypothetical protein